ncbi:uncharacterized protein LOC127859480 isoform X2 [Dreissena polymorpha]|uniref:uncharacterized protein LOC127859480 isoform X2 n=1 Tax=Dreissena polymorpha TaxID=45954 RepID=UPI002263DBC9|nr:uncharacterized protein LOC127859480 isoform X2 [Dreissena polymorpha]
MASLSESSNNYFENDISDDDYVDNEDDVRSDTFHKTINANEDATSEFDWDLFSEADRSIGKISFQHTEEHFEHDMNGETDFTVAETSNSTSTDEIYKTVPFPFALKETPVEIPYKPKRTNKNACNAERIRISNEVKASEWVLTKEDHKGISAYTGRAAHSKQKRKIVSCNGNIPSDVTDFNLPPITGTYKIRPKMKNKIPMFMPPSVLANVANSNETDTDTILARLTSAGVSEYVPCMQCHGNSSYSGGSSNGGWNQDQQNNGKCQRCGGTLISSLEAVGALRRLQTMFQIDNLIVQDVPNDGNCLFAAVVDQLRTQGIFEHDIYSLREASVEYLRTHPYAHHHLAGVLLYTIVIYMDTFDEEKYNHFKGVHIDDHSVMLHQHIALVVKTRDCFVK